MWPFAADYWHARWQNDSVGGCELSRTEDAEARAPQLVPDPATVQRLVLLGFPGDASDLEPFAALEECYYQPSSRLTADGLEAALERGVSFVPHRPDLYWGQSVAEFGLGLTICALRQIPQKYAAMTASHEVWDHFTTVGRPGQRGSQMTDDTRFSNGTVAGKRVRVAGLGNIGGRYASWCRALGADVAAWDPFAPHAAFTVAQVERRYQLEDLVADAQIFAPMLPPTDDTFHLVSAEIIEALPRGCLVVQVTRAFICDVEALHRRVLNDELALAADVFSVGPGEPGEPVPLDSPLLGRHNVVHTPHIAGRTVDANHAWVDDLADRFRTR
jgi:phosphoglycerate dehydrogenase-like enzyme